jgi:hypothetical protein
VTAGRGDAAPLAVSNGSDGGLSNGELRITIDRKMSGLISAAHAASVAPVSCPAIMPTDRWPSENTSPTASLTMFRMRNASGWAS